MENQFIYTDAEKALLQYIISVGSVKEEDLKSLYTKLKESETPHQQIALEDIPGFKERKLDDAVENINDRLHLLGYEVTKSKSQDTQEMYYVYINTVTDTPSKISTPHSAKEIDVIKKIIEKIIVECEDESFVITNTDALRICSSAAQMSASEGENFLKRVVDEGWLDRSSKGRYSLSIRALAELKKTLIDQYGVRSAENSEGQITLCKGCNEIVTNGVRCFSDPCFIKFHTGCQNHYFRANGTKCPNESCTVNWAEDTPRPVGEKRLRSR